MAKRNIGRSFSRKGGLMKKGLAAAILALFFIVPSPALAAESGSINTGDTAWVLISAALVMIMTPAVAFFYGGMVRRKNVLSTIMMCMAVLGVITIQWVLFGYSLSFGPDVGGFIGSLKYIGLRGVGQSPNSDYAATIPHLAYMIFQAMFAVITVALIVGSIVERVKFSAFLVFSVLWATLVYDPVAHWVWGVGGWIRNLGALDFAGGTVVHVSAGISALALALVLGPRKGYGREPMEPHDIPMVVLGAGLLWLGWFGFNAGSALSSNGLAASAFVVTNTSAAAAAVTWMVLGWAHRKPSALGVATGAVAGLVAITPASGYVGPLAAIAIGFGAGLFCYYAVSFRMKSSVDESLDTWGVHGIGGAWGAIATGIFASKLINPAGADGLLSGNASQVLIQFAAVAAVWIYALAVTYVLAKLVDATMGLRVEEKAEAVGLDISEHGEKAYATR
jgi:Amt family ammonium transporter